MYRPEKSASWATEQVESRVEEKGGEQIWGEGADGSYPAKIIRKIKYT